MPGRHGQRPLRQERRCAPDSAAVNCVGPPLSPGGHPCIIQPFRRVLPGFKKRLLRCCLLRDAPSSRCLFPRLLRNLMRHRLLGVSHARLHAAVPPTNRLALHVALLRHIVRGHSALHSRYVERVNIEAHQKSQEHPLCRSARPRKVAGPYPADAPPLRSCCAIWRLSVRGVIFVGYSDKTRSTSR